MAIHTSFTNIDAKTLSLPKGLKDKLATAPKPPFEEYKEDIVGLKKALIPFDGYKNILLVANGGSVWSFMSYYQALGAEKSEKKVIPVTDVEPDWLNRLMTLYRPEETLVLVISKSGSTVGVIEALFALTDYPHLYVTDPDSPLGQIGKKRGVSVIAHPPVGGRYSGLTSCAYTPAILAGLPVEEIEAGARAGYADYRKIAENNPALKTALAIYALEQKGYADIFLPIYSNFLTNFGMQITQLFHESFGKDGKGMTVLAVQAPESQHHTNQRFFGGRKNMVGLFMGVMSQKSDIKLSIPAALQDISLRTGNLSSIDGLNLSRSFFSEYIGTYADAKMQGIPLIEVGVERIDGPNTGRLMAFWHYTTVFSSYLRGVDPYDQPQVEASKVISFEERLKILTGSS